MRTRTCTDPGCGKTLSERVPALGHDWGDWIVDQQETDQADGLKHRICKTCGERQDAKIPKLEHIHNHLPTKVEPTCEEQGYTRYTCACGDTVTLEINPLLVKDLEVEYR